MSENPLQKNEAPKKDFKVEGGVIVDENGEACSERFHSVRLLSAGSGVIATGTMGALTYVLVLKDGFFTKAYFKDGFGDSVKQAEEELSDALRHAKRDENGDIIEDDHIKYCRKRLARANKNPVNGCHSMWVSGRELWGQLGAPKGVIVKEISSILIPSGVTVNGKRVNKID